MPTLPLPDGFVDTGTTLSTSATASAQLFHLEQIPSQLVEFVVSPAFSFGPFQLAQENAVAGSGSGPGREHLKWDVVIRTPNYASGPGTVNTVESVDGDFPDPPSEMDSGSYDFSYNGGPFRLGMRYVYVGDPLAFPKWAKDYQAEFRTFADEDTRFTASLGGFGPPTLYWLNNDTTPPAPAVVAGPGVTLSFEASAAPGPADGTLLVRLSLDTDTTGLADNDLTGTGSGAELHRGPVGNGAGSYFLPYQVSEHIGVVDSVGGDFGARVLDADGVLHTSPVAFEWLEPVNTWPQVPAKSKIRSWLIQAAWCLEQNPPFANNDRNILFQLAPPRGFGGASRSFFPVTIGVLTPLSVHRQDGTFRASDWVASGPGISVSETGTETIVTVTDPTASISRTLNTRFQHRIGMFGTGDPDFGYGEKEDQRHRPGEDVFSWGTYAYQDWGVRGAGVLTLTVDGSWYFIEDDYLTTGRSYSVEETQYSVSYPVTAKDTDSRVDLNFPAAGSAVPFYHGQIRKLTLSGFQVGTYRIQKIDLVASRADLKMQWGKQVSRYDYSMLHASVNGASPYLNWGDRFVKAPEVELPPGVGGPVRLANIIESPTVGTVDTQWSLEQFFDLVPGAEGMTRVWDQAAFDAACTDQFGNTIGPSLAQWAYLRESSIVGPLEFRPACSVVCGSVLLCPGVEFDLVAFHTLGGNLEALGQEGGVRATAGHVAGAYRQDSGVLVATGTSDDDGFVVVRPVRQINGELAFALQEV